MWKKTGPLFMVLSVAMNLAFVVTWTVQVGLARGPVQQTHEGLVWSPLHRQLEVTDEQWRDIEPLIVGFHREFKVVCEEISGLRTELIDLLAADTLDRERIADKQEQVLTGKRRMQQLFAEHLLAEKELLTARQQQVLFEKLRGRCRIGPRRMMDLTGMTSNSPSVSPGDDNAPNP